MHDPADNRHPQPAGFYALNSVRPSGREESERAITVRHDGRLNRLGLGTLECMRRLVGLVVVIWLAIGAVAAGQRSYFGASPQNCAGGATVAVTVMAGPLNYLGVNPKVTCRLPHPSS